MTKTRKQRRADAVERLSKTIAYGYLDDFVIIEALIEGAGLNHADMSMREDAKAIIDLLSEDECEMVDMWEREDADGVIWQDGWQCMSCGAMVNGIMPEPSTMLAPRYCPNCGAKDRKGFGDGEKSLGETENGAGDGDVRMGDAVRERRDGGADADSQAHDGLTADDQSQVPVPNETRNPMVNCGNPHGPGDAVLDAGVITSTSQNLHSSDEEQQKPSSNHEVLDGKVSFDAQKVTFAGKEMRSSTDEERAAYEKKLENLSTKTGANIFDSDKNSDDGCPDLVHGIRIDSRENIERCLRGLLKLPINEEPDAMSSGIYYNIIGYLDRQASITESEYHSFWARYKRRMEEELTHVRKACADMVDEMWDAYTSATRAGKTLMRRMTGATEDLRETRKERDEAVEFAKRIERAARERKPLDVFGVSYIPEANADQSHGPVSMGLENETRNDSRENIEADVCSRLNEMARYSWRVDETMKRAREWLDRQAAITAEACRDAWQIYRKSIELEIGDLQREVDHMRDATADMVEELWHDLAMWRDRSEDMRMDLADAESFAERVEGCVTKGEPVTLFGVDYIPERKPIVGKDGALISMGDVVYGEDGVRFEVSGFLRDREHCVVGRRRNGSCKVLRPEWLTHECPDTMGMIRDDLLMSPRNYCERHGLMPKTEDHMTFDVEKAKGLMLTHVADRLREMA